MLRVVTVLSIFVVSQAEGWIEDKLKIARQEQFKNVKDMQEKMKSLKKHQAFESEIMANADRIKAIKTVCIHNMCEFEFKWSY